MSVPSIVAGGGGRIASTDTVPSIRLAGKPVTSRVDQLRDFSLLQGASPRKDIEDPLGRPWACGALLNFFRQGELVGTGTAFLVQEDVVVTAAHCLVESEPIERLGVWIAFDAQHNPNSPAVAVVGRAIHATADIAVLVLESKQVGVIQTGDLPDGAGLPLSIAGYSMPYDDGSARYSVGVGPMITKSETGISYKINTRPGDSGAPVLYQSHGNWVAVAVHSDAATQVAGGNAGVLLSPEIRTDITQLIAYARSHVQ